MKRFERHKVLTQDLLASEILFHKKSIDILTTKLNPLIESQNNMINSKDVLLADLSKKEKKLDEAQNKFEKTRLKMELLQNCCASRFSFASSVTSRNYMSIDV